MLNRTPAFLSRIYQSFIGNSSSLPPCESPVNYETYWRTSRGSYSERFVAQVCETFGFDSVLDVGSGDGTVVRQFLKRQKQAYGIEYSKEATKTYCPDLMASGHVVNGSLTDLPFADDSFDLVFCSEVLEHIEPNSVEMAVAEIARVAKRNLFLTISLRPSSDNNKYHLTLRPRTWWESIFSRYGCTVNRSTIDRFQTTDKSASTLRIMQAGPTAAILDEIAWFIKTPPYDLHGEFEPWFFIFKKSRNTT